MAKAVAGGTLTVTEDYGEDEDLQAICRGLLSANTVRHIEGNEVAG